MGTYAKSQNHELGGFARSVPVGPISASAEHLGANSMIKNLSFDTADLQDKDRRILHPSALRRPRPPPMLHPVSALAKLLTSSCVYPPSTPRVCSSFL